MVKAVSYLGGKEMADTHSTSPGTCTLLPQPSSDPRHLPLFATPRPTPAPTPPVPGPTRTVIP